MPPGSGRWSGTGPAGSASSWRAGRAGVAELRDRVDLCRRDAIHRQPTRAGVPRWPRVATCAGRPALRRADAHADPGPDAGPGRGVDRGVLPQTARGAAGTPGSAPTAGGSDRRRRHSAPGTPGGLLHLSCAAGAGRPGNWNGEPGSRCDRDRDRDPGGVAETRVGDAWTIRGPRRAGAGGRPRRRSPAPEPVRVARSGEARIPTTCCWPAATWPGRRRVVGPGAVHAHEVLEALWKTGPASERDRGRAWPRSRSG